MDLHLQNQTVLITGALGGIGRAVAEAFADEKCSLVLWDANKQIQTTAREIAQQSGQSVTGIQVDITDEPAVNRAFQETLSHLQTLDHLVHCAAVGSGKFGFPFTNLQPRDWRKVIDVNIMGMVHLAHAVISAMLERKQGTMLFLASVAGQIGSPTDPPYSASKAANINFAQCMAKDLAPHGIRVNTLCPGMIQTPLNRSVWQAWNEQQPPENKRDYDDWAGEKVQNIVPLRRWQTPQDIAHMALFLSSSRAQNITGQTVNVDGGYVMHW